MGHVYLFYRPSDGLSKIGLTRNRVNDRLKALESNTGPLEPLWNLETDDPEGAELSLHDQLVSVRVHGEWFRLPEPEIMLICRIVHWDRSKKQFSIVDKATLALPGLHPVMKRLIYAHFVLGHHPSTLTLAAPDGC